jgi:hypothetical protein
MQLHLNGHKASNTHIPWQLSKSCTIWEAIADCDDRTKEAVHVCTHEDRVPVIYSWDPLGRALRGGRRLHSCCLIASQQTGL